MMTRNIYIAAVILALLTGATVGGAHGFINDDAWFLKSAEAGRVWYDRASNERAEWDVFWRPLSTGPTWYILHKTFGNNPIPYHVFHAWLILAVAGLLYAVARDMTGDTTAGIIAVALWACAGLNYRIYIWLSTVQCLMMMAFSLAAVLCIRRGSAGAAGAVVFYLFAMLSKEAAILLPVLFPMLAPVRTRAVWTATATAGTIALAWMAYSIVNPPQSGDYVVGLGPVWGHVAFYARALWLDLWPVVLAAPALLFLKYRDWKIMLAGAIWFGLMLAPFMVAGDPARHYSFYLSFPLMGLAVALAVPVSRVHWSAALAPALLINFAHRIYEILITGGWK